MNQKNQKYQHHYQDIQIKQSPGKNTLQIMGFKKINERLDCIPDQRSLIVLGQNNHLITKMIGLAQDKVYRVCGIKDIGRQNIPGAPKINYSNHISILKRQTGTFHNIMKLPAVIEFKRQENKQIQYKLMGSVNHTLIKLMKGFIIIGGSYRANPTDQASFSRCIFYFNSVNQTLYLISMLFEAKDCVLATVLHQSIYIFGGRIRSSALVKGTDNISTNVQRIDISQILKQQQKYSQGSKFGIQITQQNQYYLTDQQWIFKRSNQMCQRQVVSYLNQNLMPNPSYGILSGVVADNQSNSINIIGGRCNDKFLSITRTIEFGDQPNSNIITNAKESQNLAEPIAILQVQTSFQMGFKKISFFHGITDKMQNVIVKIIKDRRQQNIGFQNEIFFCRKFNIPNSANSAISKNSIVNSTFSDSKSGGSSRK